MKKNVFEQGRRREQSLKNYIPILFMANFGLSACGSGGGSSEATLSDVNSKPSNLGDEQDLQDDVVDLGTTIGRAPTIAPLPNELIFGETEIGTIYIDDETPETVTIDVTSTGTYDVQISTDNKISIISNENVAVGTTIDFTVTAVDEDGLTTEASYSVEVVSADVDLPQLNIAYEVKTEGEISLVLNVPFDASGGDARVGGMQFNLEFDPTVFTYTDGAITSLLPFVVVNSNMAEQGLLRIALASLDTKSIYTDAMVNISLDVLTNEVNSSVEFYNVSVDNVDLAATTLNIIA